MPERAGSLLYEVGNIGEVSQRLLVASHPQRIWLMEGEMGSGKTTLIKAVCEALGVEDGMTSPSFSIVK